MKKFNLVVDDEDNYDQNQTISSISNLSSGLNTKLSLFVDDDEEDKAALEKSYNISKGGTVNIGGYAINKGGLKTKVSLAEAAAAHHNAMNAQKNTLAMNSLSMTQNLSHGLSSTISKPLNPLKMTTAHSQNKFSAIASSNSGQPSAFAINDLLMLRTLGRGASAVVYLTMHMPFLTLVAQKQIGIFDTSTRHQFVKELSAYSHAISSNSKASTSKDSDISLEKSLANINSVVALQMTNSASSRSSITSSKLKSNAPVVNSTNELISFYGAGYEDGKISLLLEFMDRGSLQDYTDSFGIMSENVLRLVYRQALNGLNTLHSRHQVHRDIKPANILINHRGEVKLADFGILAILKDDDQLCKTFVGTTLYMSPERVKGEVYGYPGDIWSIGLSIIVSALGKFPYEAKHGYFGVVSMVLDEPAPTLPETFSPEIRDFIAKCLIKDPKDRWSASQLLKHPFMVADPIFVDDNWPPRRVSADRLAIDTSDLHSVIDAMIMHYYVNAKQTYRASLFDLARIDRIADQFDIPVKDITEIFENLYKGRGLQLPIKK